MKNIAIIGSNRGIGLALAKKYSKDHNVYAFCRKATPELTALKLTKVIEDFDVLKTSELSSKVKQNIDTPLDSLLHVSGILSSESLEQFNEEQIINQFKVNSLGPIVSVRAFLPLLKSGSKVGLVTSRMGSISDNTSGGMYGYRMSKAALNMAGKSLAIDLKPKNIHVTLLHPGYVKTDMTNKNGNIDTDESATGLINVFENQKKESGSFWHMSGEQIEW